MVTCSSRDPQRCIELVLRTLKLYSQEPTPLKNTSYRISPKDFEMLYVLFFCHLYKEYRISPKDFEINFFAIVYELSKI